jgi:hypothetical protein
VVSESNVDWPGLLTKKLRLKGGYRAIVLNAPESYAPALAHVPADVEMASQLEGPIDFIHVFVTHRDEMERQIPALRDALKPQGLLWVSYPKGTAIPTDLKRDVLWKMLGDAGLQAVAQVSIDEVWSAMRFKHA